jgi:hypothetical protein
VYGGPHQLDTHDQGHDHAKEDADESEPEIAKADDFVAVSE